MTEKRIGVVVTGADSGAILESVKNAEQSGISAAWLTTGGAGLDALTLYAGSMVTTKQILLGTSIIPTFPRHPLSVVQQVQVVAQLGPGRFRLGLGTGGGAGITANFGIEYRAPLRHLSEYIRIVKTLLQQGAVDFDGRYLTAHAQIVSAVDVPVMAAALGAKAYEMCGSLADGAISWVCPSAYLRDVAFPAMKTGAEKADRPMPPLLAHVPVCVHEDLGEARDAVRQQFGYFARSTSYQKMFVAAGFPETMQGNWSDAMVDGVALMGNESQVTEKIEALFALGATEILASPVAAGGDGAASLERTTSLLSQTARKLGS